MGSRHAPLTDRRTSLIVDPPNGRLPPLTPEAQRRAASAPRPAANAPSPTVPRTSALNERCLQWATAGPPMLPGVYNNNVQFVQTRDYVVILNEMIHDARIVPMDGRPHGTMQRWMGDSRGHWEGATLVVDTVELHEQDRRARLRRQPASRRAVHARRTRTRSTTSSPLRTRRCGPAVDRVRFRCTARADGIYEYACHEGNFRSMQGMLLGARAAERR